MSPRRAQVRLDPDVAEALQAAADAAAHSLAQEANLLLRQILAVPLTAATTPPKSPNSARVHAPIGALRGRPGVAEARRRADQHRIARRG